MTKHSIQRFSTNSRMSKAVIASGLAFLSGQTASGTDFETIEAQTEEALRRIDMYLAEVGTSKEHLLSATVYLSEITDFQRMNQVWEAWLAPGHSPARTTVEARLASPNLRVEFTVIASVNS